MNKQSRRSFLKRAGVVAGAVAGARLANGPFVLSADAVQDKLRVAVIGCGGQGTGAHVPQAARQTLVALVDPDSRNIAKAMAKAQTANKELNPESVKTFADYREMFDKMPKGIDAIIVATPNHHHAPPALMAMKRGIAAYVEKPLCYDMNEARMMAEYSKKYKVASQMGNQGHCGEGYRRLCEYIWAGAIGNVTEVHCWSDRANGGSGGRPEKSDPPAGMNWDTWIGAAPYRDYHKDLHPHSWHGWHDFGNGSLGNMGCHVMDGAHWALKLGSPTSIMVEAMNGGSAERYPVGTKICWDYPARGDMPAVKVYWWDGKRSAPATGQNRPPLADELEKKYDRKFGGNGTLYVGDKGVMFTGTYGDGTRILPEELHKAFPAPAKTLPRVSGGVHGNFFNAIRTGEPAASNFETASKLTEMIVLGCLAIKAGQGNKVEWDGTKCTNNPAVNRFLQREYRKGWEV